MINYIKGLDGLRAFAIIFVVIHHSHFITKSGFFFHTADFMGSGVDLFFIISGFLITNILLASKGKKNFFKRFYIRRLLRIVPLYYLVLFIAFAVIPSIDSQYFSKFKDTLSWPYWFFLSNYYIASKGHFQNGLVDLSWSLSVEEQFYVFWSICVYYFQSKNLKLIAIAIIILAPVLRFILIRNGVNLVAIHVMSITRLDTLMVGSLMALILNERTISIKVYTWSFLVLIILLFININLPQIYYLTFNYTLLSFAYACLIGLVLSFNRNKESKFLKFLEFKPIALIGVYSYGIYLFHNPIQKGLRVLFNQFSNLSFFPEMQQLFFYFLVLLVSCFIACISYVFYESKWLLLKNKFD